ncbi:hypothetical protein [Marinobacter salexigens]|uniref:Uncharacterized protein n=1 Tax=Marinobacter salexigens TaxID=1925763 RepID=A0ABS6A954_9GAMM|nr:hypothetical protein [Marinobacter salexigens]MBU2874561.1 hypothetical protein [Marinobacter salexigens]
MQHPLIEYRVAVEKHYHHLSTLSRELRRRTVKGQPYDAEAAGLAARLARSRCRPRRKLVEGTDLHGVLSDDDTSSKERIELHRALRELYDKLRELNRDLFRLKRLYLLDL